MQPRRLPPEWRALTDPTTGARVLQWTSGETMNHHCYFTNPTTSTDGRYGFFVSYRTGYPNLFKIDLQSGELFQLTNRVDINPFSPAPARSGPFVYVSAQDRVHQVHTETGEDRVLCRFPTNRLGNCSLNWNGSLMAIGVRYHDFCELAIIDTQTGAVEVALRAPEVGHVQFCPGDDSLLLYSGTVHRRIWCYDRRTGQSHWVYEQGANEWIVHESWLGQSKEIIFTHWPYALKAIRHDGTGLRTVVSINAWHACSNAGGSAIVCDTNHPDRGLLMIDPQTGAWTTLCRPAVGLRAAMVSSPSHVWSRWPPRDLYE